MGREELWLRFLRWALQIEFGRTSDCCVGDSDRATPGSSRAGSISACHHFSKERRLELRLLQWPLQVHLGGTCDRGISNSRGTRADGVGNSSADPEEQQLQLRILHWPLERHLGGTCDFGVGDSGRASTGGTSACALLSDSEEQWVQLLSLIHI